VSFGCAQIASARVDADLALDDVERGDDFNVTDVVPAEVDMHEAGDELFRLRVLVVGQPCMNEFAQLPTPMDRDADLVLLAPATRAFKRHCRSIHSLDCLHQLLADVQDPLSDGDPRRGGEEHERTRGARPTVRARALR